MALRTSLEAELCLFGASCATLTVRYRSKEAAGELPAWCEQCSSTYRVDDKRLWVGTDRRGEQACPRWCALCALLDRLRIMGGEAVHIKIVDMRESQSSTHVSAHLFGDVYTVTSPPLADACAAMHSLLQTF